MEIRVKTGEKRKVDKSVEVKDAEGKATVVTKSIDEDVVVDFETHPAELVSSVVRRFRRLHMPKVSEDLGGALLRDDGVPLHGDKTVGAVLKPDDTRTYRVHVER